MHARQLKLLVDHSALSMKGCRTHTNCKYTYLAPSNSSSSSRVVPFLAGSAMAQTLSQSLKT